MSAPPASRYASLTRAELARLVPELLLMGQLIDRSGMAWCISAFGREEMARIAIEEWSGASPVYTRRMQRALRFEGDDVVTIFKGLQLDIGAPPQFMDFRYVVHDPWHGEFHLDHCGALMDVEPLGPDYVRSMCHDIEDPTFDATAVATNPRAQVRPIHRPPRAPADRQPHCAWTVRIDPSHPPVSPLPAYDVLSRTRAAEVELAPIDPGDEGLADYSGPLLSDVDFGAFSHSALVRIADEVCLQMHLLHLSFAHAVGLRTEPAAAREICRKQLVGVAGLGAERIHRALGIGRSPMDAVRLLALHPVFNPVAYVPATLDVAEPELTVRPGPAHEDGAWVTWCGPGQVSALQAIVRAVDPSYDVSVTPLAAGPSADSNDPSGGVSAPAEGASAPSVDGRHWLGLDDGSGGANAPAGDAAHRVSGVGGWRLTVIEGEPAAEAEEVAVTRFSTGAEFAFEPRCSLPLFPADPR